MISVIIPAYNRADLIGKTLNSILNQTVPAFEIIVVDDGSQDDTAGAVEREFSVFCRQFSASPCPTSSSPLSAIRHSSLPLLRLIRQENAGPGAARNRGFAESKGEFIHFFDSDDIALPNKHEVQLRALQESNADIAYGPWVKGRFLPAEQARRESNVERRVQRNQSESICESQPSTSATPLGFSTFLDTRQSTLDSPDPSASASPSSRPSTLGPRLQTFVPEGPVLQQNGLPKGDLIKALLTNWSVVPHACLFRRSIVEKANGFPENLVVGEDQLMFLNCLLAGAKVVHSAETLELYRTGNTGKITGSNDGMQRYVREWARYLVEADAACQNHAIDPKKWFGFRRRAWEAKQDLAMLRISLPELTSNLTDILKGKTPQCFYFLEREFQRKRSGLLYRLGKGRAHSCFCAGPITSVQQDGMRNALASSDGQLQ